MTTDNAANGRLFRLPPIHWPVLFIVTLSLTVGGYTWLSWMSVQEWRASREGLAAIATRVALRESVRDQYNARILNELRLQTMTAMLPQDEQRQMLRTLLQRLDSDTQDKVLSLKLRSLRAIGEQEAPNEVERRRR